MILLVSISNNSRLLTLVGNPKDRFSGDEAQIIKLATNNWKRTWILSSENKQSYRKSGLLHTSLLIVAITLYILIWATSWENQLLRYANNKGADQPAQPRSLISTFVDCCLDSIISILAKSKISRLASLSSWAGRFESYLVENPEDRFPRDEAHLWSYMYVVSWTSQLLLVNRLEGLSLPRNSIPLLTDQLDMISLTGP